MERSAGGFGTGVAAGSCPVVQMWFGLLDGQEPWAKVLEVTQGPAELPALGAPAQPELGAAELSVPLQEGK